MTEILKIERAIGDLTVKLQAISHRYPEQILGLIWSAIQDLESAETHIATIRRQIEDSPNPNHVGPW